MKTHQVLIILVVDTRVFGCIADSLQERRFASISPSDYKDTEAGIFRPKVIRRLKVTVPHGRCGRLRVKRDCSHRGNTVGVETLSYVNPVSFALL